MALSPLPYASGQTVLGHFRVAQKSGAIDHSGGALTTLTLATGANALARLRWTGQYYLVLERIRVGVSINTAVTAAVEYGLQAAIVRSFSVDYSAAITSANLASATKTNAMRSAMGYSQMGTAGPAVCTTTVMSGQTLVGDANAFATTPIPTIVPTTATGTAVALPVGYATPMYTLYDWTGPGAHPVVLAGGEGVILGFQGGSPATGKSSLYVEWEWAEVLSY